MSELVTQSPHEDGHSAKRKFDCIAHSLNNNEASDCFVSDTMPRRRRTRCMMTRLILDQSGQFCPLSDRLQDPCISCWAFLTHHRSTLITAEQLDTHSASSASYASSDTSDSSDSSHPRLLTLARVIELVRQVGGVAGKLISVNGLTTGLTNKSANNSASKAKARSPNGSPKESCDDHSMDDTIPTCYRDFVRRRARQAPRVFAPCARYVSQDEAAPRQDPRCRALSI